ncbi:hypothetical protein, variant [Verruconis gallopava]|uniref:F-box domain-containing protein n=1 Tax=Verruconis gallopava TaxID=253628 RepID=A0A0D2A3E8_9PEZI|nr:uncharacterized protein PV09_07671 [Verruconis gallopava]XP_016210800.1 hypothetical protein, variant [Verruconis gallopava]KIW00930.1 hypothetical protein PV09_07671 [Verruconis gallopava]KIW00931.1 hypothetical protein, variant [Verruconis gallopava]
MTMNSTEAELEKFRQEWKQEVSAKVKSHAKANRSGPSNPSPAATKTTAPSRTTQPNPSALSFYNSHNDDDLAPQGYHDIDQQLGGSQHDLAQASFLAREPRTALEHYEKAVEKEGQGSLGDSLSLYRKAFRMDSNVDKKYRNKHFPPSAYVASKPSYSNPPNAFATVPNHSQHSLIGLSKTVADLISDFSALSITGEPASTEFSPTPACPIAKIPEEILSQILMNVAITDVASMARLALVCKRLAFLVLTEESIWKRLVHSRDVGLRGMHYQFACTIKGEPIRTPNDIMDTSPVVERVLDITLPLTPLFPTYRQMFRQRPRIRFNGCYISTVNYTRPGVAATSVTWNSPVFIVTYYRYLRFFRDGSLISLLSTSEPRDVIPYLQPEYMHQNHANTAPQNVMKDALKGRWRLTGNPWKIIQAEDGSEESDEPEGDLIIETEGVVPKYMYKMHLTLGSAGKGTRNNKLTWRGYWSWNRLTDDWAEFGLKNDRAFYWSRVRSFGNDV